MTYEFELKSTTGDHPIHQAYHRACAVAVALNPNTTQPWVKEVGHYLAPYGVRIERRHSRNVTFRDGEVREIKSFILIFESEAHAAHFVLSV